MYLDNARLSPNLTEREHQVLERVAAGLSAKEIALLIDIAPRTVERHIENIRLKMNAKNRAHMVAQAIYFGVLKIEGAPSTEPNLFLDGPRLMASR